MSGTSFTVEDENFRTAAAALEAGNFEKVAGQAIAPAFRNIANAVRKNVRAEAKPHRHTGKMAGNVRARVKGTGLKITAGVRATGAVSNLIVGGTKAHREGDGVKVMPMWGGRGSFRKGSGRGIEGFARNVEHPAVAGDPFFDRGVAKSREAIDHETQNAATAMAAALAKAMEGHR